MTESVIDVLEPRRRAGADIKLLRLEIVPQSNSPCEDIGTLWSPAQPTENLSPQKAAGFLGVEVWAPQSVVKHRYRTLQLRYPPEQFGARHLDWRPSAELLSNPRSRLNWYWQSGLIPTFSSEAKDAPDSLWSSATVEAPLGPVDVFKRLSESAVSKV